MPSEPPPEVAGFTRRYHKIFPSYSHRDSAVVANFATVARTLGDQYLQDVLVLRPGERWHPRLLQLIEEADVFQLFWSRNSMRSPHCREEWEHALALQRPDFVLPVYWEEPRPQDPEQGLPPEALQALHFVKWPGAGPEPVSPPEPPGRTSSTAASRTSTPVTGPATASRPRQRPRTVLAYPAEVAGTARARRVPRPAARTGGDTSCPNHRALTGRFPIRAGPAAATRRQPPGPGPRGNGSRFGWY
jgi:hypothetical protein